MPICARARACSASASRTARRSTTCLPEAFATVREAAKRALGQRHYDVQLIGGVVLHRGGIAEMRTGEGKTLVSTLPAYLNALAGSRARRHGQRLPRAPRRRVDGRGAPLPRARGGRDPARPRRRRAPRRLRRRHHLRHEQRARLRLPARQHEVHQRAAGPGAARVRDRRRGRLDPDRRSPHAADHLGAVGAEHPALRARRPRSCRSSSRARRARSPRRSRRPATTGSTRRGTARRSPKRACTRSSSCCGSRTSTTRT